jgi:hypothetical protein
MCSHCLTSIFSLRDIHETSPYFNALFHTGEINEYLTRDKFPAPFDFTVNILIGLSQICLSISWIFYTPKGNIALVTVTGSQRA